TSLIGSIDALGMASPRDFQIDAGAYAWLMARPGLPPGFRGHNEVLADLWSGQTGIELDGRRANAALQTINSQGYAARPAGWPTGGFAEQLWTIAQSIRFDLGLRFAALDLGGWDTHENQGTAGSGYHYYQNKIRELSAGLAAFYGELNGTGQMSRVTVIVQSEFGRRVRANANDGTDHGYGNPLLVLGGPVNGRRFYGSWPGLDPEVLSATFGDIPVTTDYRRVFSEVMIRRMANPNIGTVFPGYSGYAPLGIVQGTDLAPQAMASAIPMGSSPASNTGAGNDVSAGPIHAAGALQQDRAVPQWRRSAINRMGILRKD
ncbi:MAG TPA: DUF1501 domain-containing protein, partial [Pseudoxanthomonas sp.]|nr:DUF1501 domain-containing protein [Pseudoxanthomonas sp.]